MISTTAATSLLTSLSPLKMSPHYHFCLHRVRDPAVFHQVNRVQHHHCNNTYCLRKKKLPWQLLDPQASPQPQNELACRFYFPQETHNEAIVTTRINPHYWMFDGVRNDVILNVFNPTILIA